MVKITKCPEELIEGFKELIKGVIQTKINAETSFCYHLKIEDETYFVELSIKPEKENE